MYKCLMYALGGLVMVCPSALAQESTDLAPLVPVLIEALSDADSSVRANAGDALARLGELALPKVKDLFHSSDKKLHVEGARVLGKMAFHGHRYSDMLPPLVKAMKDEDVELRREASYALVQMVAGRIQPEKNLKPGNGSEFVEQKCEEGKFTFKMPGTPRRSEKDGAITFDLVTDGMYQVEYKQDKNGKLVFDAILKVVKAKETTKAVKPKLGVHSGREMEYSVKETKIRIRVFFVEDRVYKLMVVGVGNFTRSDNATKFLNSITLLPELVP